MRLFKALFLLVVALPVEANLCVGDSVDSYRLSDYIKSNGSGSMDLFDGNDFVVDGAYLENLRAGHGGELVFALDVNENASGSEKAESQGVAYKSATLTLTFIDGNVVVSISSRP